MGDGWDYDWASLGVKPGAGDTAVYVNGYVRGEWAEMTNTIELGRSQGHHGAVRAIHLAPSTPTSTSTMCESPSSTPRATVRT